jgi:hypothetical protein
MNDKQQYSQKGKGNKGNEKADTDYGNSADIDHGGEYIRHFKSLGSGVEKHDGQVFYKKGCANGAYHDRDTGRIPEGPVCYSFKANTNQTGETNGNQKSNPPGHEGRRHQIKGDIGSQHEYVPMGKVDEPQDAVDHGVAYGDEGIEAAQGKGISYIL